MSNRPPPEAHTFDLLRGLPKSCILEFFALDLRAYLWPSYPLSVREALMRLFSLLFCNILHLNIPSYLPINSLPPLELWTNNIPALQYLCWNCLRSLAQIELSELTRGFCSEYSLQSHGVRPDFCQCNKVLRLLGSLCYWSRRRFIAHYCVVVSRLGGIAWALCWPHYSLKAILLNTPVPRLLVPCFADIGHQYLTDSEKIPFAESTRAWASLPLKFLDSSRVYSDVRVI